MFSWTSSCFGSAHNARVSLRFVEYVCSGEMQSEEEIVLRASTDTQKIPRCFAAIMYV